jgi:hypothetical protein
MWERQAMQHLMQKYERKRPLGGMIILKWTSRKGVSECGLSLSALEYGP